MHLCKFMFYLLIGLLLVIYCCCIFLAFDSYIFDLWALTSIISVFLSGALFLDWKCKKLRFSSLFPTVIVILGFSLFSPVRPFLNFFFSLDIGMSISQIRTALNHDFSGKFQFSLPREDQLRSSDEEKASGISEFMYVVNPFDGTVNCDTIVIKFDQKNRLVAARYSSKIIPSI